MIVLVIFLVAIMTVYDYIDLKNMTDNEFSNLQVQTEDSITAALHLDDTATTIIDDQLDQQMVSGFDILFAEYNRSGENPADMNLTRVKEIPGEGYDIYVINESSVIVYTTYPPEQGEDFRNIPYSLPVPDKGQAVAGFLPGSRGSGDTGHRYVP